MTFERKFGNKCGKKLMDTSTKTGIDAAKTTFKRVGQKTAEATGALIGNKIADKIISVCKAKSKEKKTKVKKFTYHQKKGSKYWWLKIVLTPYKYGIPKKLSLLDKTFVPRFITKKWIEVNDQTGTAEDRYKPSKQIRFKTSMLRSDLCDYSDAYIVVKENITLTEAANRNLIDVRNRVLAFKNNAPFTSIYISKINNVLIDNAKDLDVVMPMYNLFECSKNYSKTTGSLRNCYRDEPNDFPAKNYNANPVTNSKSFKYETSITRKI